MKRFLIGGFEQLFLLGIFVGSLFVIFGDRITAAVATESSKTAVVTKVSESERKEESRSANYN